MWFIFALITALCWGGSDFFSKKGTNPRDKYSHLRMIIMVGGVMGIHAIGVMLYEFFANGNVFDPMSIITYLPVSFFYILSMALGYMGLRYIELSVSSPICNSSGAVTVLLCFFFLGQTMAPIQFVAVLMIFVGIYALALVERRNDNRERLYKGETVEKKYQVGFIAILLPILYCIIDGLGTFADAIVLNDENPMLSEFNANTAYELTFLFCAICCFIYIVAIKKQKFRIIEEKEKGFGAVCETIGQFFYVYAIADNAIIAAPMISSYCVFSVLLSRIFLKEKLSRKQYAIIAFVVVGIVILGVFDEM